MATQRSSASPPPHADREHRTLPHTLSFINNVQNAIAAIENRLEHNPSAQPPPPHRNEYPAQHGTNRDNIYSATVKHLEQPVLLPPPTPTLSSTHASADAEARLSPQSTISSLGIDEAVSVTSDYHVSASPASPAQRFKAPTTTRSIADIVQHFESNTTTQLSPGASKHPSSSSIAPIVHRFEHRSLHRSKPAPSIAPIVDQFQRPAHSKSSVSFADDTETFYTESKRSAVADEDEVDLCSVGATVDPSEFESIPDDSDCVSQRSLSAASISRSLSDQQHSSRPMTPPNESHGVAQTAVSHVHSDAADAVGFEGTTANVDALCKSLYVDADNLEVTDESVARAIKTLDTYSMAAGIPTLAEPALAPIGSDERQGAATTSACAEGGIQTNSRTQQDTSSPVEDPSREEPQRASHAHVTHAAAPRSHHDGRAQPPAPMPLAENLDILEVESNTRSYTITSTTVARRTDGDPRPGHASVIETVMTSTTNQIHGSAHHTLTVAAKDCSQVTLNACALQGAAKGHDSLATPDGTSDHSAPIRSSPENMAVTHNAASTLVLPAHLGSVAAVPAVPQARGQVEPITSVPADEPVPPAASDAHEQVESTSSAAHDIVQKITHDNISAASDSPLDTVTAPLPVTVHQRTRDVVETTMTSTPLSPAADAPSQKDSVQVTQQDVTPVHQPEDTVPASEHREAPESLLGTETHSAQVAPSEADSSQPATVGVERKNVKSEPKRTLTPSRIPRRSHSTSSPASSSASGARVERSDGEVDAVPRRRAGGSVTPTSLSPASRIISSRLPPTRASPSGTSTPSSRSAATSPRGLNPLRGRGASASVQQHSRRSSLGPMRKLSNDRKPVKLPRVAELLSARNRDRSSSSPGNRVPRGATFNGASPGGLAAQMGAIRRAGTTSSPVTPNNRPKSSPQEVTDMGPLNAPLRRTLSFNNNRRATLCPASLRGAAASSQLQHRRGMPGANGSRRATLSETRRPPRSPITIPEPFHLTGAELQAKARKQLEEQRRKREEMERRRRVFKARPMPDFSNPSPKPYF